MSAPDKIYIQTHKGETLSSKWTTIPFRDFENEEYIRKDALLEWVRLAYGKLSMNPFDVQGVFEELINKINSL